MPEKGKEAADTYLFEGRRQLQWAPALANGTAVLALANIVANAANQDRALDALVLPMAIHGAGLCAAMTSTCLSSRAFIYQTSFANTAEDIHDTINPLIKRFNRADDEQKLEFARELKALMPWVNKEQPRLAKSLALYKKCDRIGRVFAVLAVGFCAAGFFSLLIGHQLRWLRLS